MLFFVVVAAMPPQFLYWDDLGFLERARDPIQLDYGHALYVPTLRGWRAFLSLFDFTTEEYAAKMLSSIFAAFVFVLLWKRLERTGLATTSAIALSALVGTTPFFWRQTGIVEPTTPTLAFLLLAARAAERYGEARTLGRAIALVLFCSITFGYHVVSVLALPWLVHLAWSRPRPPLRHLLVPASLTLALALVLTLARKLSVLATLFGYWTGFLPPFSSETLVENRAEGWTILVHGFPVLLVLGGLGIVLSAARKRFPRGLVLGLPYGLAFLFLGAPKVGLLLPVSVSLGLVAGEAFASFERRRPLALVGELLASAVLAFQVGFGLVRAYDRAVTPDTLQESATLMAGGLPKGSLLLAGPTAHHVLWFTEVPCVALPNEIHSAPTRPDGKKDVIALVREVARRMSPSYERVYLSSEALDYLVWRWNADPTTLSLDAEGTIVVRDDPALYLVPLAIPKP